jgi:outer membrane protein
VQYMSNLGLSSVRCGREPQPHSLVPHRPLRRAGLVFRGLRTDKQQIYIANWACRASRWAGFKYTDNSSIDWAYSYRQTEAALKFEKNF